MNTNAASAGSPREIFLAALDIEDEPQRRAYVAQACGSNTERRLYVEKLLAAHAAGVASPLDRAIQQLAPDATVHEQATAEETACSEGEVIDRYRLLEQIGEGGMGIVYVAEQTEPVRRQVALKVIKPGMDSKVVVARFEAERQALALMDHPNVARVIDAGTTGSGRPYFVMELVRGLPITEYCDQAGLDIRQRLELFVKVCQAVQHAHQKGIIHRDLKPSNVMVTLHDSVPVPKVIDFGVAKALNQKLTEQTIYTQDRQLIGTPAYMSPEQAEMSGLDVDTRSDVYSLGVLLYELLTGTTPFEKQTLEALSFDEMRRLIREQDPPRPSQRISTLDTAADSKLQQQRGIDRRQLGQSLRRELDWIVMRALEKDHNRRYESASALAGDVERYLADELVSARPPSKAYRYRKFARRNKGFLAVFTAVFATLVLGISLTTWQWFQTRQAERDTAVALQNERGARVEAERSDTESRIRLRQLYVAHGVEMAEEGDLLRALPWFAHASALETDVGEPSLLNRRRISSILHESPELVQCQFEQDGVNPLELDFSQVEPVVKDDHVSITDSGPTSKTTRLPLLRGGRRSMSPDGKRCAFFGSDWLRFWSVSEHQPVCDYITLPPPSPIDGHVREYRMIWSLDGRRAAIYAYMPPRLHELDETSTTTEISVWDPTTGDRVGAPIVISDVVTQATLSPDGHLVFVRLAKPSQGVVRSVDTDDPTTPVLSHDNAITCAMFDDTSTSLVTTTWGPNGKVHIWDISSATATIPDLRPANGWEQCVMSSNARFLLAYGESGATVFDMKRRVQLAHFSHNDHVNMATFSPDMRFVATACRDGSARVWTVGGQPRTPLLWHLDDVVSVQFSPSCRFLLTKTAADAKVWDLSTVGPVEVRHGDYVSGDPVFSADGMSAAMSASRWNSSKGAQDYFLIVLDTNEATITKVIPHPARIASLCFSSDARMVATAGDDNSVRVWRVDSGNECLPPLVLETKPQCISFGADDTRIAIAAPRRITIHDLRSGKTLLSRDSFVEVVQGAFVPRDISFDASGSLLAVSDSQTTEIWGASDGKLLCPAIQRKSTQHTALAFSDDGSRFAAVSGDGSEVSIMAPSPPRLFCTVSHNGPVTFVAFSPDGTHLATGSDDKTARVWDATTGDPISPPLSHEGAVKHVSFGLNGRLLATSSTDKTARVWDVASGLPVTHPLQHPYYVGRTHFAPDASSLISAIRGPYAACIRRWHLSPTTYSDSELRDLSAVLACAEIDQTGGLVPLSQERQAQAWHRLVGGERRGTHGMSWEKSEWHVRCADECEEWYHHVGTVYHLGRLIEGRPDDPTLFSRRAAARGKIGEHEDALADCTVALAMDPSDDRTWLIRADLLAKMGRFKEARSDYRRSIDEGCDIPEVFFRYALLSYFEGDTKGHMEMCERLINAFAVSGSVRTAALAVRACTVARRNTMEGDEVAREAIAQFKHRKEPLDRVSMGVIAFRNGECEDAVLRLSGDGHRDSKTPADVRRHLFLAMAYKMLGRDHEASEHLEQSEEAMSVISDMDFYDLPWAEKMEIDILRREAVEAIGSAD